MEKGGKWEEEVGMCVCERKGMSLGVPYVYRFISLIYDPQKIYTSKFQSQSQVDVWRRGLLRRTCRHNTENATPPDVHLTSFYVRILPGLPPR